MNSDTNNGCNKPLNSFGENESPTDNPSYNRVMDELEEMVKQSHEVPELDFSKETYYE